jgi:glutamine amidotransferase
MRSVAVVDFGAGNLKSVVKAVRYLGHEVRVTRSAQDIDEASVIILPGVGAASPALDDLEERRLAEPIKKAVLEGRPFLGICLGLQVLFEFTEEGDRPCLGLLKGRVKRLPAGVKVPHMGWNLVRQRRPHPLFQGIPNPAFFYFVHSYYPDPEENGVAAGETEYGVAFSSVIIRDNLVATQFHPEKSGQLGLQVLRNFLSAVLH